MVYPERCRLLHQVTPDAILKHPNCPLYLPVGFAVANSYAVVNDAQPFAELCEAAHKLGDIICPDVLWLAPMGNRSLYRSLVALQLCSEGMVWVYTQGDKEVMVSILILWEWTHCIDALSDEWCATFVHPI